MMQREINLITLKNQYPPTLYAAESYSRSTNRPSVVGEDAIEYEFIDMLKTLNKEHHV